MFSHPFPYPYSIPVPPYPVYTMNYHIPRTYPAVDPTIFSASIKSFRLLMTQGSILLDRLGNLQFARQIMTAAQEGKHHEVNRLIQSIGLKVPVKTTYTPTGVNFELIAQSHPNIPNSCCTLTINLKWGR